MKKTQKSDPKPWRNPEIIAFVRRALREDIGPGDITSRALIGPERRVRATIVSRGKYVLAGLGLARLVFNLVDKGVKCRCLAVDGGKVKRGGRIMELEGRARSILAAERTALNFLQRLTGIATLTARYVAAVKQFRVKILDTRKTTPNVRLLEKYAVRCGGGHNHRLGLYDRVLIKDNHRFLWGTKTLAMAIEHARRKYPRIPIEVEVESLAQLHDVIRAKPDWVMLDNMPPALMKKCVAICAGRCRLEASGGISLKNIRAIAATGVDAISIGALTHSAPAADLSLEVERSAANLIASAKSKRNPAKPMPSSIAPLKRPGIRSRRSANLNNNKTYW